MPRSLKEILDAAEAAADAFEAMGNDGTEAVLRDATPLRNVRAAALARHSAEQALLEAVREARLAGFPWALIGSYLGTSGEAARQRYGALISARQPAGNASEATGDAAGTVRAKKARAKGGDVPAPSSKARRGA
jgi:FAD/FMN-containing dehydrogenase